MTPAPDGYPIKLVRDNTPQILGRHDEFDLRAENR